MDRAAESLTRIPLADVANPNLNPVLGLALIIGLVTLAAGLGLGLRGRPAVAFACGSLGGMAGAAGMTLVIFDVGDTATLWTLGFASFAAF